MSTTTASSAPVRKKKLSPRKKAQRVRIAHVIVVCDSFTTGAFNLRDHRIC